MGLRAAMGPVFKIHDCMFGGEEEALGLPASRRMTPTTR